MTYPKQSKILEVIVGNLQDALEAEHGGADRLEIVRDLKHGGLTPDTALVEQIIEQVKIPVRVMLRQNSSMSLLNTAELDCLCRKAAELSRLPIDGLVTGFLANGDLDLATLCTLAATAPSMKLTFHRAFDHLPDPIEAIRILKTVPQVDRILTTGGSGPWATRKLRLHLWQHYAAPQITILAGAGLLQPVISDLQRDPQIREIHIGRAARIPQNTAGKVCRIQVAQLKGRSE